MRSCATRSAVARLARDAKLRKRYQGFLRTVWAEGEPVMRELGRPTVERAVQRACASLEHGQSPLELIGEDHIARREKFIHFTEQALRDGTLVLTPCYIAEIGRASCRERVYGLV